MFPTNGIGIGPGGIRDHFLTSLRSIKTGIARTAAAADQNEKAGRTAMIKKLGGLERPREIASLAVESSGILVVIKHVKGEKRGEKRKGVIIIILGKLSYSWIVYQLKNARISNFVARGTSDTKYFVYTQS